jgi:hypothetical protein
MKRVVTVSLRKEKRNRYGTCYVGEAVMLLKESCHVWPSGTYSSTVWRLTRMRNTRLNKPGGLRQPNKVCCYGYPSLKFSADSRGDYLATTIVTRPIKLVW